MPDRENEQEAIDFARIAGLSHDIEKAARALRSAAVRCQPSAAADAAEDVHDLAGRALDLTNPPAMRTSDGDPS